VKKILSLSSLATLAIALGMISWGSAAHAIHCDAERPADAANAAITTVAAEPAFAGNAAGRSEAGFVADPDVATAVESYAAVRYAESVYAAAEHASARHAVSEQQPRFFQAL